MTSAFGNSHDALVTKVTGVTVCLWMDSVVVSDSLQLNQYQQHVVTMTVRPTTLLYSTIG